MKDDRVGIRELRQHLSRYLRRVEEGETLKVMDRGREVAILAPLPGLAGAGDRWVAAGRARPPRLDLVRLPPPVELPGRPDLAAALEAERAES